MLIKLIIEIVVCALCGSVAGKIMARKSRALS